MITEGKAKIDAGAESKITRKMDVFYNPAMRFNRDVSVLLLGASGMKGMRIADPLAASGVRSIRFIRELGKGMVKEVLINDGSPAAVRNIRKNLKLNRVSSKKALVSNEEATIFLLKNRPFDYIDLDPFGSPVKFLDAAIRSLSRNGILAVTATDTAALSGSSPRACLRKYWAVPLRNSMMHELGLRILARRVQLAAASHEKALTPAYSVSRLHYMRIFFRCSNRLSDVDTMLKQQKFVVECKICRAISVVAAEVNGCASCKSRKVAVAGPLWAGRLWDKKLAAVIARDNQDEGNSSVLAAIAKEAGIDAFGFYDTHQLCRSMKSPVPPINKVISALKKAGYAAERTHLDGNGIRSNAPHAAFMKILKKLA